MNSTPDFIIVLVPARGCAPKGRKRIAQGFNPGYDVIKRRALKGHQDLRSTFNSWCQDPTLTRSGATFRAHLFGITYPGLKPWAVLLHPCGAEDSLSDGADFISRRLRRLLRRSRKDENGGR